MRAGQFERYVEHLATLRVHITARWNRPCGTGGSVRVRLLAFGQVMVAGEGDLPSATTEPRVLVSLARGS
jgi:hypothetical protein